MVTAIAHSVVLALFGRLRRIARCASTTMLLAVAAIAGLLLVPGLRADTPTCSSDSTTLHPPGSAAPSACDVPINDAKQLIQAQIHHLQLLSVKEFTIYRKANLARILSSRGVGDWEQAVLLEGESDTWAYAGYFNPNGGAALGFVTDFYLKNVGPLTKSLDYLKRKDAPTSVPRADLEYMKERFQQLIDFEPTLSRLIDSALELDGDLAVLELERLKNAEQWMKWTLTFNLNLLDATGNPSVVPMTGDVWGSQLTALLGVSAGPPPQLRPSWGDDQRQNQRSGQELSARYNALQTQFTVELGKRAPSTGSPAPAPIEHFPDDAIGD
ncbi:MAG: hypothetical protein ABSB77_25945 [Xanthobacteraceae bacterium]|jgi:hypothetical protein